MAHSFVSLGFQEIALSFSFSTPLSFRFCCLYSDVGGCLFVSFSSHSLPWSPCPQPCLIQALPQSPCMPVLCCTPICTRTPAKGVDIEPLCSQIGYFFPEFSLDSGMGSSSKKGPSSHRHQTSESSLTLFPPPFPYLITQQILWVLPSKHF